MRRRRDDDVPLLCSVRRLPGGTAGHDGERRADNNADNNAHRQQRRRPTWTAKNRLVRAPELDRGQS